MTHKQCSCLLVGAFVALAGCGGGMGEVSGTVKYKGQPLTTGATISFYDESGHAWSGTVETNGTYKVPSVPAGRAKIAVTGALAVRVPGIAPQPTFQLPEKYGDRDKSGLVYEVQSGAQTHNIDLVDSP
jgi:hypothetical protein